MTRRVPGLASIAAALTALGLFAVSAGAETLEPTRHDDPTPGKCKPHDCSLREAVIASNAHAARDTIVLGRGRYELQIPPMGDDTGSIDLDDGATLKGQGARKTKIDANDLDTAVDVGSNNSLGDEFVIRGLTITGGDSSSFGGGINAVTFEDDALRLDDVGVKKNVAQFGAGIYADLLELTITDSRIAGNQASDHGGGIRAGSSSTTPDAKLRVIRSIVKGNTAALGGGIYDFFPSTHTSATTIDGNQATEGGGLDIVGWNDPPYTAIRATTISNNIATKGGGILADGNQPSASFEKPAVDVINSTVAQNETVNEGGGIMADNGATLNLNHATVAYNLADRNASGGGNGGGVEQHSGAIFGLADSVVAKNEVGSSGTGPQCDGTFAGTAGGVVESQTTGTCTIPGSFVVPDALIGPLAHNGGPTQTVKLLSGSPAIQGARESCPKLDQRGVKRPHENCDSGAYERKGP
jgi:hypothetical protein